MPLPHCQLLTRPEEVEALAGEWDELLGDSGSDTVFGTWDWTAAWLTHFGAGAAWRVWTVRDDDGRLLGLAPLAIRPLRYAGIDHSELLLCGSWPTVADHLDILVRRRHERVVAPMLRRVFDATCRICDLVRLDGVVPGSAVLGAWLVTLSRLQRTRRHVFCPYISLPGEWPLFLSRLPKHERASVRRAERQLDREFAGKVQVRQVSSAEELEPAMDALFRLHQAFHTRRGHAGSFADPAVEAFHRDVAGRFLRRGWLRMTVLTADDTTIAADYGFSRHGTWSDFSTGYDHAWMHYAPGKRLLAHAIRAAIAAGDREYDMLRGAEAYKLRLTRDSRAVLQARVAMTPTGRFLLAMQEAQQGAADLSRPLRLKIWRGVRYLSHRRAA